MSNAFDVIVIGAGPGGYVCAIRAAQLGLKTAIVEKRMSDGAKDATLGGTCLNVGCIPSKALLDSSEHFYNATHHFKEHGIILKDKPGVDMPNMLKRKAGIVKNLTGGIGYLMKKNKITVLSGHGRLGADENTVIVTDADGGDQSYTAKDVVLAMGSVPVELPFLPFDGEHIISSTEALELDAVPEKLLVVGGGVIGLELGSVYARLGAEVTVVEFMDNIAAGFEDEFAKGLQKCLAKIGMKFELGCKVTGAETAGDVTTVHAENKKGEAVSFTANKVLVAVGRRPLSESAGLDAAGVTTDERGRIPVNEHYQTNKPHVYALGDLTAGPMLAHKAEEEGVAVAEIIAGQKGHVDLDLIPGVIYTWPELATVGQSEQVLKEAGRNLKVGRFPFAVNGRAMASGDTDGFVKVVADADTDALLGVTILGPRASDLIAEAVTVMAFGGTAEDIALICHAHPTFSEAVKEAALDALGRVLHS